MSIHNTLILFENHFTNFRRHYPYRTRMNIAADLGYDGYEFETIEPDDDLTWRQAGDAFDDSGLNHCGMYVVVKGVSDDQELRLDAEIKRMRQIIQRLATFEPAPYLLLTVGSSSSAAGGRYDESGSALAEQRHWDRARTIVREADDSLLANGMRGHLYNHVWLTTDTPQAVLRVLHEAEARTIGPALASFHAHFHQAVPDPPELLALPGMDQLGYVALLNAVPQPEPFRTVPLDQGNIDMAGLLAALWAHDYRGPIVTQAYDIGGDPYLVAARAIEYVSGIWERFERNPAVNPLTQ